MPSSLYDGELLAQRDGLSKGVCDSDHAVPLDIRHLAIDNSGAIVQIFRGSDEICSCCIDIRQERLTNLSFLSARKRQFDCKTGQFGKKADCRSGRRLHELAEAPDSVLNLKEPSDDQSPTAAKISEIQHVRVCSSACLLSRQSCLRQWMRGRLQP